MASTDTGLQFREVITKAVCGKGRQFSHNTHELNLPDSISSVLGAWAINHSFDATKVGDSVEITGNYDINIWYAHANNTKTDVAKHTVSYVNRVPLSYIDRNVRDDSVEVIAHVTHPPNCIEATIVEEREQLHVKVEYEFLVELVGETKLTVAVTNADFEGDDKGFEPADFNHGGGQEYEELDPELVIDDLND